MFLKMDMTFVAFDCGPLRDAVHPFYFAIDPRMIDLRQPVFKPMLPPNHRGSPLNVAVAPLSGVLS